MRNNEILFIGGSNYDITGKIKDSTIPNDSNPSSNYGGLGGVGRNIAINTSNLGIKVSFISAFGSDLFSKELMKSVKNANIDISESFIFQDKSASTYVSILDKDGELELAACDVSILEDIDTKEFLKKEEYINSFPNLFLDANLTDKQLIGIANIYKGRIFMDAVSIKKAERIIPILKHIDTLKVNKLELKAISNLPVETIDEVIFAAKSVIDMGVKRIFVTLGTDGSLCITKDGISFSDAIKVDPISVTGAGDSYMSAIIYGTINNFNDSEILLLGTIAAKTTLLSPYAVSEELNESLLIEEFKKYIK